ncbi:heat shock protein beta-3 isoform X2 [Oncorhynchus mykiss]|uniref:heat shock protein beta-3 isoform X2 n=1 Tax=Oncorhynchus mykiss TaxID=8022 RepID=UPI0018776BE9|nr:heat shock protein beta-3 isoform X2 [Oncorhynchus mykiss]
MAIKEKTTQEAFWDMDWEEGRTMEGLSITHWVNSPVRHQALFQGRDLDDCVEDHDLFALPGPAFPDPGVVRPDPGVVRPDPGVVRPDPGVVRPDPGVVRPDPWVVRPDPGVVRPDPGVVKLEGVCDDTTTTQPQRTQPVYQVLLDVSQFRPEDIMIQVFEGWLLIKAQHGARMDEHGFVTRSFTRQYPLPEKLQQAGGLRALLCHDGILVVESKQRTPVRIQHTEEDPY